MSTLVKMPHCWKSHVTAQFVTTSQPPMGNGGPEEKQDLGLHCLTRIVWKYIRLNTVYHLGNM